MEPGQEVLEVADLLHVVPEPRAPLGLAEREAAQRRVRSAHPPWQMREVAFALGYRDATTFGRAFRRWTGDTPGAWRERTNLPE